MKLNNEQIESNIIAELNEALKILVIPEPVYTLKKSDIDFEELEDLVFVVPEITILESDCALTYHIARFIRRSIRLNSLLNFDIPTFTDPSTKSDFLNLAFEGMKELWLAYNNKHIWRRTALAKKPRTHSNMLWIADLYIDAYKCGLFAKDSQVRLTPDTTVAAKLFSSKFEEALSTSK